MQVFELYLILLQASDNATRLGVAVLENFEVFPERNWFWIGTGALLGFAILFNILFTFALMYLNRENNILFKGLFEINISISFG